MSTKTFDVMRHLSSIAVLNEKASLKKATLDLERDIAKQERLFGSLANTLGTFTLELNQHDFTLEKKTKN